MLKCGTYTIGTFFTCLIIALFWAQLLSMGDPSIGSRELSFSDAVHQVLSPGTMLVIGVAHFCAFFIGFYVDLQQRSNN